jgi:hypothetical protein
MFRWLHASSLGCSADLSDHVIRQTAEKKAFQKDYGKADGNHEPSLCGKEQAFTRPIQK